MLKEIRPLVDFNYDLRKKLPPQSKGKIQKYYNALKQAQGQKTRIYRPRSKSKLRLVQKAAGMELNGFRAALIPDLDPENKIRVVIKNGQVTFKTRHSNKIFHEFNIPNLINDENAEIDRVLNSMNYDFMSIACGEFEYGSGRYYQDKQSVKQKTLHLINQYSSDPTANNYFTKWLGGFWGISVKNQEQLDAARLKSRNYKKIKGKKKNGKKKNRNG